MNRPIPFLQDSTDLYKKTRCRYCQSPLPEPFLDLGTMPLANSFLTSEQSKDVEFVCPLRTTGCSTCGLVQLTHVVPPEKMFSNYLYVSSTTATFQKHFTDYARTAKSRLESKDSKILAVDIGSNDGLLLSCYQTEGMRAVGVEPAQNLAEQANRKGLKTISDFFGPRAVDLILREAGQAHIVSANNVFAHIDDIAEVCRCVLSLLHPQGIFIIEFPYLVTMFEKMYFDMLYHEHLSYIAVRPLRHLLSQLNLEIFAIEEVRSHGGSLRVFIQKQGAGRPISAEVQNFLEAELQKGYDFSAVYQDFAHRVHQVKRNLLAFIRQIKATGKTLSGYGAPAKGNTLINFCELTPREIEYIVDDSPLKQNLLTPGAHIPVVSSTHLFDHPTDFVVLFAWNFAEEILKKLSPLRSREVKFIVPLPEPRIV